MARARRSSDLSFEIAPGRAGGAGRASGSGKSTIANLLLRFLPPDAGQITLDGVDLSALPLEAWREQIAWVSQSPYLFNTTIADNIRFGRPEASRCSGDRGGAGRGAHDFITRCRRLQTLVRRARPAPERRAGAAHRHGARFPARCAAADPGRTDLAA